MTIFNTQTSYFGPKRKKERRSKTMKDYLMMKLSTGFRVYGYIGFNPKTLNPKPKPI
jgi:hypothetical protein